MKYIINIDITHVFEIEADDPSEAEYQAWQELSHNPEDYGRAYVKEEKE